MRIFLHEFLYKNASFFNRINENDKQKIVLKRPKDFRMYKFSLFKISGKMKWTHKSQSPHLSPVIPNHFEKKILTNLLKSLIIIYAFYFCSFFFSSATATHSYMQPINKTGTEFFCVEKQGTNNRTSSQTNKQTKIEQIT